MSVIALQLSLNLRKGCREILSSGNVSHAVQSCSNVLLSLNTHSQEVIRCTVEPVYNGPVLSGHPVLTCQFLKSRLLTHTNAVFVTCIRRQPLLSGRGHPVKVLCLSFFVIFTCI